MHPVFLAAFLAGLVLGVYAMLYGVERHRGALPLRVEAGARYPARLWSPALAGFLAAFGAAGYLVGRFGTMAPLPRLLVAAVAGLLGAVGAVMLVTRWAIPGALHEAVDERYLLQGHVGRCVDPIDAASGMVAFEVDGGRHRVPARALDGVPIPAGTDVVIERIEDGVAYVESWSAVEQRI